MAQKKYGTNERGESLNPNFNGLTGKPHTTNAAWVKKCARDAGQVARERSGKPEK